MRRGSVVASLLLSVSVSPAFAQLAQNGSFEFFTLGPDFSLKNYGFTFPADGALLGWTVGSGSVDLVRNSFMQAADGNWSIQLNGAGGGASVQQTFATTPGQQYLVSFEMAGNPRGGPALKTLTASAAQTTQSLQFSTQFTAPNAMGWQPMSFSFVASGASTTLSFASAALGTLAVSGAMDGAAAVTRRGRDHHHGEHGEHRGEHGEHRGEHGEHAFDGDHDRFFRHNIPGVGGPFIDNVVITAVPEPETYALLLAGLGMIGLAARRRSLFLGA